MIDYTEVVNRLKNGEDPVDLSIEKWELIKRWLGEGGDFNGEGYGYCALCHLYEHDCDFCPLVLHNPCYRCEEFGSPFVKFMDEEIVENAQAMIDTLKELKPITYDCCGKPLQWDEEGEPIKEHCELCSGDTCPDCDNQTDDYGTLCPMCYDEVKDGES